jgi:hypothetical protein
VRWRAILDALPIGRRSRESTLIVPVPAARPALEASLAVDDGDDALDLPHITLLYRFVPARAIDDSVETAVAEIATAFKPFCSGSLGCPRFRACSTSSPTPTSPS